MDTEYFIERCRGIFSNFVKWQLKSACINGLRAKICVYIVISAALFCLSFGDALCGLFFFAAFCENSTFYLQELSCEGGRSCKTLINQLKRDFLH